MKKLLSFLFIFVLLVSCKSPEPVIEPIGYGTTLYIDTFFSNSVESIEELKESKIIYQKTIDFDENEYIINELINLGFSEDNFICVDSYRDYPGCIEKKECDAWIVSDNTYILLKDYYNDFDDSIFKRIATYQMPIYEEEVKDEKIFNNSLYAKPFCAMLTGIDQRVDPDQNAKALNDVNLMIVVDPVNNHILTLSFPRDSYLYSPTLGHSRKMTEIGPVSRDVNAIKEAVGNLLDIEIPYYVQTSFSGFVDLIGHLGGVWVDVPMDTRMDMDSYRNVAQPYEVEKGYTKLYGEWALALARNRKYNGIYGGDYGRIRNQCLLVNGIINKILTYPEIISWAHFDWYANKVATFNFTDDELQVLYALADKFHDEGYTIDNYFIENVGSMTEYGASIGLVTDYSKQIAKGKIDLVLNGIIDETNPYYEEIMTGNVTGGANQQEYITNEYDLKEKYLEDKENNIEEIEEIDNEESIN